MHYVNQCWHMTLTINVTCPNEILNCYDTQGNWQCIHGLVQHIVKTVFLILEDKQKKLKPKTPATYDIYNFHIYPCSLAPFFGGFDHSPHMTSPNKQSSGAREKNNLGTLS